MMKRIFSMMLIVSCMLTFIIEPVSAKAADEKLINKIEVLDFVVPVEGQSEFNKSFSIPEDANYKVMGTFWDAPFVFEADKTYTFTMSFEPNEGYIFDDVSNINATINGKSVDSIKKNEQNGFISISSDFIIEKSNIAYRFDVNNVSRPESGKKASVESFEYIKSEKYYYSDVYWYNETEQKRLSQDDVFKGGNDYSAVFEVTLASNEYIFADGFCIRAYVNDRSVQLKREGNDKIIFKLTFIALDKKEIDHVEMTVSTPELGEKPENMEVKIPDNANYSIIDVKWYDSNNNEIEKGSVFEKTGSPMGSLSGEYYFTVSVTVKSKDGILFSENGLSASVNNDDAGIFFVDEDDFEDDPRDRSLVRVTYKFVYKIDENENTDENGNKDENENKNENENENKDENVNGDVNGDKLITMEDVTTLQKIIAKLVNFEIYGDFSKERSDCNHDGEVNMIDVVMIQKHIAELINLSK